MSELRDALATALGPAFLDAPDDAWEDIYPFIAVTNVFTGRVADAVLADPAFREALRAGIAEALAGGPEGIALTESLYKPGTSALDLHDEWWTTPNDLAAKVVEGMLGDGAR